MTESDNNPPPVLPPADEFEAYHQHRFYLFTVLGIVLALVSTISYFAIGEGSLVLPILSLVFLAILVVIWRYPSATFYLLFAAILVFEVNVSNHPDAIVDKIPFFRNINTIIQMYTDKTVNAFPINPMEVLLLITGVFAALRAIFDHRGKIVLGPLFLPITAYMVFVMLGWINGMLTGGDFKISLQEVRPQFYFLMAYLMAVNTIKTPGHLQRIYWITVLCIGLKGIIYTIRRNTVFAGMALPDQGVGSHEEAFFFDCFEMLLIILSFCNIQKHLRRVMCFLLPIVVLGNLATNRRAGTAAIIIVMPILLLAAHRVLPKYRKGIAAFGLAIIILGPLYYFTFRHSESMLGQPARAIASQFDPDARDAGSNAYRDAENADLVATIHLAPLQGYGYGKRMLHVAPIADISKLYDWWDIITHNQVLWVWMRTGTLGMVAFWMMVSAIIIYACRTIRSESATAEVKAIGIFTMMVICMLMFFGLLDLQFTNYRDMLFGGFWVGILVNASRLTPPLPTQEKGITP